MNKTTNSFSHQERERAVRLVLDQEGEHPPWGAAITSIAAMIGCSCNALLEWLKKAEACSGKRAGVRQRGRAGVMRFILCGFVAVVAGVGFESTTIRL